MDEGRRRDVELDTFEFTNLAVVAFLLLSSLTRSHSVSRELSGLLLFTERTLHSSSLSEPRTSTLELVLRRDWREVE